MLVLFSVCGVCPSRDCFSYDTVQTLLFTFNIVQWYSDVHSHMMMSCRRYLVVAMKRSCAVAQLCSCSYSHSSQHVRNLLSVCLCLYMPVRWYFLCFVSPAAPLLMELLLPLPASTFPLPAFSVGGSGKSSNRRGYAGRVGRLFVIFSRLDVGERSKISHVRTIVSIWPEIQSLFNIDIRDESEIIFPTTQIYYGTAAEYNCQYVPVV